ncbi:hypothetical protein [Brachybacterium fresconis]|uniref:DUF4913 domain-containing protein n=1 Tax=Brachybacterium fresconis TaxID=173363 RepID=A0ABS4YGE6_9MICO|nr:hypothetical protein [Brachybacterium fresconis]MBP2407876.1 hypothetical protein [Brachybacterium fresconis]
MNAHTPPPEPDESDLDDDLDDDFDTEMANESVGGPPHPVNWNLLSAHDLEQEWLELNRWIDWLRHTYGLPAAVIPPFWHHHPELVWELSALHLHWLSAYDPEQNGSAPIGWHRDFADARVRLRDWVAASGTRLDRDRPTRQTTWPGEEPAPPMEDIVIGDRDDEFVDFVREQVKQRQAAEDAFFATIDDATGEVFDHRVGDHRQQGAR